MTERGVQLTLEFPLSAWSRFDTFVTGRNGDLIRRLEVFAAQTTFGGCLVYGPAGGGRTHLLQAVCHRHGAGAAGGGAIYLPLADPAVRPDALDGLENLDLVALDDVDHWLGGAEAERALLALYQGLEARDGRLLLSAAEPAVRLAFAFADLASRLRALPGYQVHTLPDADKAEVLKRLAGERGLKLSKAVLTFWLSRSRRNLTSLVDQLDRLDSAAMAEQRRVTVPLVKRVLGL